MMLRIFRLIRLLMGTFAFVLIFAANSRAENFTFAGTFTRDDEVRLFAFTVVSPASVALRTLSYDGGANTDGVVFAGGGFSPILALFDNSGALLSLGSGYTDFPASGQDPSEDAFIQSELQPGRYFFSLTQYFNFPVGPNLTDGFLVTDDPTFTREFGGAGATGPFIDPLGDQRGGNFAVEITQVAEAAPVPEPATLLLLTTGLAGAGAAARRRRRKGEKREAT